MPERLAGGIVVHRPIGFDVDGRPFDCEVDGEPWPCSVARADESVGTGAPPGAKARGVRLMAALDLYEQFLAAPEDSQANRDGVSWLNYKLHADALAAEVRAVLDLHHRLGGGMCSECDVIWPCETAAILGATS